MAGRAAVKRKPARKHPVPPAVALKLDTGYLTIEEVARVDPAIALSLAAHNGLCSAHIN